MVLATFRLLNTPAAAVPQEAAVLLCEGPPRAWFILDPGIAGALLRSDRVIPTSGQRYYAAVSGLARSDFPLLSEAFERTPLSLSGSAHRDARSRITPLYRRVEAGIDHWIDAFCAAYLEDLRTRIAPDLMQAASDFSDRVSRAMAARELDIGWQEIPPVPNEIFMLFPSAARLRQIEEKFAAIHDMVTTCLRSQGRDSEDFWPIFTLMMMNRDAMQGTLAHMFCHLARGTVLGSASECAIAASNVSLLQCREVVEDCEIAGHSWSCGDLLQISPYLLHQRAPPPAGTDFTFGAGPHACPGRKLSLRILDALIRALRTQPLPEGFFIPIPRLFRQIILTAET